MVPTLWSASVFFLSSSGISEETFIYLLLAIATIREGKHIYDP
jgi:hypothetical protein